MAQTLISPDEPPTSAESERAALVRRIVSSRYFAKALQLRRILVYICEQTLADPAVLIREHDIGCNVLGRRPDFNPHEDNIVRVQVSHLRRKLDEYFVTEGRDEVLRLTIPKGSYVAHFEPHSEEPGIASPEAVASPAVEPVKPVPHPPRYRAAMLTLAGTSIFLGAACMFLWLRTAPASPERSQDYPFWSRIFSTGQPANIVIADTCLVMMQDILGSDISLATYLSKDFPQNLLQQAPEGPLRAALTLISGRQYTSLADINVASKLMELSGRVSRNKAAIRYARYLNTRDFKRDNFVLIGSRRGNPWVQLFETQVNFALEEDSKTHRFFFHNKLPQPEEQSRYGETVENKSVVETYADIELLPNLGNNGYVLILCGISMEATEAAGELVSNPDFANILAQTLRQSRIQKSGSYFEILLRIRAIAGTPGNSQIIAHRVVQPHVS